MSYRDSDLDKVRRLRDRTGLTIDDWLREGRRIEGASIGNNYTYLARLVGHVRNDMTFFDEADIDPTVVKRLEALNGPHGWAVHKLLLAQKG